MSATERLDEAISRANDMVIGASIAIMDRRSTPAEAAQASFFQSLFSAIRDVLQEASVGEPSRATLKLADAVMAEATS